MQNILEILVKRISERTEKKNENSSKRTTESKRKSSVQKV